MPHRPPFNISVPLVAATSFIFAGDQYEKGDPFPKPQMPPVKFPARLLRRQYEARKVDHVEEAEPEADVVQMTGPKGGRYTITAPWLDEPEVVRGKTLAERRFDELRDAGPPLGWIEGGSPVTVSDGDGGWYTVEAPWLEVPERVQGREAAEARQLELHQKGEPQSWGGVSLIEAQNGYWHVQAEWQDEPENVHGEQAARERAAELREEGPPKDGGQDDGGAPDVDGGKAPKSESGEGGAQDDAPSEQPDEREGVEGDGEATERQGAETVPGTGPAQAADDVEAAAGARPSGD